MQQERSQKLQSYLEELSTDHVGFEGMDFTDLDVRNSEGENALHPAAFNGETDIIRELIDLGITLDARGDLAKTPLHYAASCSHLDSFRILAQAGASLVAVDELGQTPVSVANLRGRQEIVDCVLELIFPTEELASSDRRILESYRDYYQRKSEEAKKRLESL